jgi:hypothetical protein
MPRSNWRNILAIVGLIALAIGALGYRELQRAEIDPYPDAHYQPARSPSFPDGWPNQNYPHSEGYEPNCQKPADREDSDLCAQWSAVKVVSESNRLSRIALNVNAIGLAAVLFSLLFTGWAAVAASQSARVAERALIELEQPVVAVDIPKSGLVSESDGSFRFAGGSIEFRCSNYGRSPAILKEIVAEFKALDASAPFPDPIDPSSGGGRRLPAGCVAASEVPYIETQKAFTTYDTALLAPGAAARFRIYFFGYIRYVDVFNNRYIHGFFYVYDDVGARFVRRGDESRNYTRKEKA